MMKKSTLKIWAGVMMIALLASSCEDYLDVNKNPNAATDASVQLILPQAIVASASVASTYNGYGGHFGGYVANAGGFSGFGNLFNYNLTPTDFQGLWNTTYFDPLADLKYVIDKSEGDDALAYFNAAAKIMTVVNYQRLVDAYGNIPYTQALSGEDGILAPSYDDAATVYLSLIDLLDNAITTIDDAAIPLRLTRASDPLFGSRTSTERPIAEQMDDWKRYANTLKLRMLIRTSTTASPAADWANFDLSIGVLNKDAVVDPGYELNRPNPTWATWGRTIAGQLAGTAQSRVPTKFSYTFYGGTADFLTPKITDPARGETIYANFGEVGGPTAPAATIRTPVNQLGNESGGADNPFVIGNVVTWASNEDDYLGRNLIGTGVLKGPGMGQPLMLKAESHFLLAEAYTRGYIGGVNLTLAKTNFNNGIKSSFAYLYTDENESRKDTTGLVAAYLAANSTNDLVVFDLATTEALRLEAIITQKYIALNMINADEAWNEFRRTGFPTTVPGGAPALDIASNKSETGTPDRLPTRIMYPTTEQSYNAGNYVNINYKADKIFWDVN